jgi:hypothetical protein
MKELAVPHRSVGVGCIGIFSSFHTVLVTDRPTDRSTLSQPEVASLGNLSDPEDL